MKYLNTILTLVTAIILSFSNGKAQSTLEWYEFYSEPDFRNAPNAAVVDDNGNIYMTGETIDFSAEQETDILTIKFDKDGNLVWTSTKNDDCDQDDAGNAIAIDSDGNVYVAGYVDNCYNFDDYAIIKYDANGNFLWMTTYDTPPYGGYLPFNDRATNIFVDDNGNVYVTGTCGNYDAQNQYIHRDIGTLKLDANGNILWDRRFNTEENGDDIPMGISVNKAGEVSVIGYRHSQNSLEDGDILTLMYDANGNLKWKDRYDGPLNGGDYGVAIVNDDEGNVYVAGTQDKLNDDSNADLYIAKYDANGTKIWSDVVDNNIPGVGSRYDEPTDMLIDGNGNLIIAGDDSGFRACILKYSLDGEQIWKKFWTPSDWAYENSGLCVDAENNVYISGDTSIGDGEDAVSVLVGAKFDEDGNLVSNVVFDRGISDEDFANVILGCGVDRDNSFYLTGHNYYNTTADIAFTAVKFNMVTAVNDDNPTAEKFSLNQNYPNPFNPSATISFSIPETDFVTLIVYNSIGQEVAKLIDSELSAGTRQVQFNAANLPSGIYFYRLQAGNYSATKKCILLK